MDRRRALLLAARHGAAGIGLALTRRLPAQTGVSNQTGDTAPAALAGAVSLVLEQVEVAGSQIELQFAGAFDAASRERCRIWVQRSRDAVASYFGRFPQTHLELLLQAAPRAGVQGGATMIHTAPYIRVHVGPDSSTAQLLDDWVLVHEMVHLAVPRVPRHQHWLHEGIATYVEGVVRTRAGITSASQLWGELARGMPQGQPRAGDQGLDHTPTWGRTYWGGAIFCLLADVQMLRASQGRAGLRQALQGLLAAGGSYAAAWPVARILAVADAGVGQSTLSDLYTSMKDQAVAVDLEALWRDLGVANYAGSGATLLDNAPGSALRRAIAA